MSHWDQVAGVPSGSPINAAEVLDPPCIRGQDGDLSGHCTRPISQGQRVVRSHVPYPESVWAGSSRVGGAASGYAEDRHNQGEEVGS
jgi:hypothetical protein